jgi:hypothetical protein
MSVARIGGWRLAKPSEDLGRVRTSKNAPVPSHLSPW